ncbi:enoyl-CoA delta isomerase 2, mitochondrial-like, partial [Stylophora pistillata]|uniref:enoyl-CoA delta isomerase 2, mitochondrial-like n=1 Tax=Stylophora pistillata TaxID=50429 RepID=UPI000C04C86C
GNLEEEFQSASERTKTLKQDPGNDHKLKLYALFEQGSIGKCNSPKPGAFDFVGKAKWTAWNDLGDLSKVDLYSACLLFSKICETIPERDW